MTNPLDDRLIQHVGQAMDLLHERQDQAKEIAANKRRIEYQSSDAIQVCDDNSWWFEDDPEQAKAYWSRILAHAAKRLRDLSPGPTPAEAWQVNGERDAEEREADRRDDEDAGREADDE